RLTIHPRPPLGRRAELLDERGEPLPLGLELAHDAVALRFGAPLPGDVAKDADRHPDRAAAVEDRRRLDRNPSLTAAEAELDAKNSFGDHVATRREGTGEIGFAERSPIHVEDLDSLGEIARVSAEAARSAVVAAHARAGVIDEDQLSRGVMSGYAVGNAVENPGKKLRA